MRTFVEVLRIAPVISRCGDLAENLGRGREEESSDRNSAPQDDVDAIEDQFQFLAGQPAGSLDQRRLVQRDDLRDIRDRVSVETSGSGRQWHVAGRLGQREVAGQSHADDRRDATAIERIALHDHNRSSETRSRALGLSQIGPPDFALADHQSVRLSVLRAAAWANSWDSASSSYTASRALVTRSSE